MIRDGFGYCKTLAEIEHEEAVEMAQVGIVPSTEGPEEEPVGHVFEMAGQRFVVTGYATREEFLEAIRAAGLPVASYVRCPPHYHFQRISTD